MYYSQFLILLFVYIFLTIVCILINPFIVQKMIKITKKKIEKKIDNIDIDLEKKQILKENLFIEISLKEEYMEIDDTSLLILNFIENIYKLYKDLKTIVYKSIS